MSLFSILVAVQILLAICLIIIVMIQQGKGAEAGAALSGGSQSLLGTASGGSKITRATAILATLFILNSLTLAAITPQNSALDSIILKSEESPSKSNSNNEDVPNIPLPQ